MHPLYTKANDLSPIVIRCAIEVYKHFGPGLIESIYTRCLARELELQGHHVLMENAKLLDVPLGLILNFGDIRFGDRGIQRVILKGADSD